MIVGTVIGTLLVTTFIIVIAMLVQRRQNVRNHQRDVEIQIRDDLLRGGSGGGGSARPSQRERRHATSEVLNQGDSMNLVLR